MISIRYEKCDPEGCDNSIRPVSFLLGAPDLFSAPPSSPRSPHILSYRMVSLFFAADHSGAHVTSIVGRYSTINSASALTRIYRVSRGSVQRTEETSLPHVLFTRRLFLFRRGKEPSLFRLYRVPSKFIPPSRGSQPRFYLPATCMFAKQKNPPPARVFVREVRGIISWIKAATIRRDIKRHRRQRVRHFTRANCI